jgi:outer membrane protein TolC
VRYAGQVMEAASVSAELARRMAATGNFNKLQHAREQSFQADATVNLARAQQWQRASRERLTRLMGLWGEQIAFRLPERLPDPPASLDARTDLESLAMAQRFDVQGARLAAERTARSLGLTRATRFINVLEVGTARERSNEAPDKTAWEVSLELPIFDSGNARLARAEAVYRQALNRAAETAITARSEVREAWSASRSAWEIARYHREQIVPLRQRIAEENLLRYNGMLIGVFELLADARAQISSVNAAIEALRDFWLAQADLDMALIGRPVSPMGAPTLARPADPPAHAQPH